jgi:hypothetical protein
LLREDASKKEAAEAEENGETRWHQQMVAE